MPHVYVRAWTLCCFHSLISTESFRRALSVSVDCCAKIKSACPFSGVTTSGRVWRKVLESDARCVPVPNSPLRQSLGVQLPNHREYPI